MVASWLSSRSATLRAAKLGPEEPPVPIERIRNFCIIAHVDHGKSTLADRLLEATGTIAQSAKNAQVLDTMALERERGITIKLQAARMEYTAANGERYVLNLIDTPGHVDFGYEVERSLQACEGALLVVDASQGVEAQTIAVVQSARLLGLEIVPVLNKIDLPTASCERTAAEVESILGLDCSAAIHASAKNRVGIGAILEAIVARVPPPAAGSRDRPLRALVFDSYYDAYKGVVASVRIVDGSLRLGERIACLNSGAQHETLELGVLVPQPRAVRALSAGEVGYIAGGIKALADARVGETIALATDALPPPSRVLPLPGYRDPRPMVFCGLYLHDGDRFELLRDSLAKLALNDAALAYAPCTSEALGSGFRVGFLGLLHMEVVQQRLQREYGLELVMTAPSVAYKVTTTRGDELLVDSPDKYPDSTSIARVDEPFCDVEILAPFECTGALMELCQESRGDFANMQPASEGRVLLKYALPLAEVITDFFDTLKSRSHGYASMDYKPSGYRPTSVVKLDILINGEKASPLAMIVHKDAALSTGRRLATRLKELIPRQQFKVPIQAVVGAKVIASEHIAALRKDVTAKCYGGDQSRKKKLLMRQAEGKKRMKEIGRVSVPQSAFMACLSLRSTAGDAAAAGG